MAYIAKWTAACALVAHDHEGRRAFAKALADIRAAGFFANRVQFVLAQNVFDFVKARVGAARLHAYPIGFFQHRHALLDLDWYARQFGMGLLLEAGVVIGSALRLAYGVGAIDRHCRAYPL